MLLLCLFSKCYNMLMTHTNVVEVQRNKCTKLSGSFIVVQCLSATLFPFQFCLSVIYF